MNPENVLLRRSIGLVVVGVSLLFPPRTHGEGCGNGTKTFTAPEEMVKADWSDAAEMQRTWDAALVRVPAAEGKVRKFSMAVMTEASFSEQTKYPTVIYLHGCSGVWQGTYRRIDFLAENGFAVIAPLSFARKKYPQSCDTKNHRGGMYRPTLKMRQFDAGFAIQNAKNLSWVDAKNIFLMGLSQGGITTATFRSEDPRSAVNARVVEGWTCHAGWEEYRGVNAPKREPVLTLVGERDPWFQRPATAGDCGSFLNTKNGSRSVVFRQGPLRARHELFEANEVKQIVLEFLRDHLRD